MTLSQERAAYRRTVELVLTDFLQTDPKVAAGLVKDWWQRLSQTSAYKSGIFLHAEPLNTAADLAGVRPVRLESRERERYLELVEKAMSPLPAKVGKPSAQPVATQALRLGRDRLAATEEPLFVSHSH